MTSRVGSAVPSAVITLATTLAVTLGGFCLWLTEAWRPLTGREVALLGAAAAFVGLGSLAIIKAMRIGEMSVVSPFRYTIVLTTLVVGYAVFGDWPDLYACLGIGLIVASGLYTLHREQMRLKNAMTAQARVAVAGESL